MEQSKEYFAFISYQRKDEEWADTLRNNLEYYRLPSSVRKQNVSPSKAKNANIDIRQTARVFEERVFVDGNHSAGIPLEYCSHTLGILYPYSKHTLSILKQYG